MSNLRDTLSDLAKGLTEENCDVSLAQYCFWLNVGVAHGHISDQSQVSNDVHRIMRPELLRPDQGQLIHPAVRLLTRFIRDIESDGTISEQVSELRKNCAENVDAFFEENLSLVRSRGWQAQSTTFLIKANLIAFWANLGYVEEVVIRDRIIQSLLSHSKLHDHQADALVVLFGLAGGTFGAYVNPSVVDRCFELLKDHYGHWSAKRKPILEAIQLRESGWKGLPPPPVFTTGRSNPIGVGYNATTTATPLGPSNTGPSAQIPQPNPPKPVAAPKINTVPASSATQVPAISIASLSKFTITDKSAVDPMTITRHSTFYLEDGNVEVMCGHTLFRVHTSTLSFHSPTLRQMFAQIRLETARSPNNCPRVLSSTAATDFATLLKVIYLPDFPKRNAVPDFDTFSSLLRVTAEYEVPAFQPRLLEVIRDAYPDTFDKVKPTKPLGEATFSGQTPHPNEVLNFFIQQKVTIALPVAYYMAAREGVDSFMDSRLPQSATLSPEVLQTVIKGFIALRELERDEIHRLILGPTTSHWCSSANCPSRKTKDLKLSDAHQKVVDKIASSSRPSTKVLQVLSLSGTYTGDPDGFCENCLRGWEAGHVGVRKKAWGMLSKAFGLGG